MKTDIVRLDSRLILNPNNPDKVILISAISARDAALETLQVLSTKLLTKHFLPPVPLCPIWFWMWSITIFATSPIFSRNLEHSMTESYLTR
ncbi:MAG: hypothetical protein LBV77_02745 [Candidatus Adiutrix intracellularis]|nr:hypothetical protein [Candidatus Adiutrix intracellularis]